jgi:hypothetical protein
MSVTELLQQVKERMKGLADKLDTKQRMQIALNTGVSLGTINRYLDPEYITNGSRLELAEKIIDEAEKLLAEPETSK